MNNESLETALSFLYLAQVYWGFFILILETHTQMHTSQTESSEEWIFCNDLQQLCIIVGGGRALMDDAQRGVNTTFGICVRCTITGCQPESCRPSAGSLLLWYEPNASFPRGCSHVYQPFVLTMNLLNKPTESCCIFTPSITSHRRLGSASPFFL